MFHSCLFFIYLVFSFEFCRNVLKMWIICKTNKNKRGKIGFSLILSASLHEYRLKIIFFSKKIIFWSLMCEVVSTSAVQIPQSCNNITLDHSFWTRRYKIVYVWILDLCVDEFEMGIWDRAKENNQKSIKNRCNEYFTARNAGIKFR